LEKNQENQENLEEILNQAEANASPEGRNILEVSRSLISNKEIIVGGCWDYIHTVFDRAGYSQKERETIFKSKFKGPYFDSENVQTGDWLYYVNHTYRDTEHSAIFVAWINKEKKEALMISYVGEKKRKPGEYKKFVIDKIYNVIRAK
jgi:hypothetical protein